jgi:DNA replication protein DnaC
MVAAAIVDRLLHNATVLNIRSRSYRMRAHQDLPPSKNGRL